MRNIGQCKCGNDIKIDDLVADGDGFLAYQCPNCMKIFYSHDKPRNVAKPVACPQLYEGWRDVREELPSDSNMVLGAWIETCGDVKLWNYAVVKYNRYNQNEWMKNTEVVKVEFWKVIDPPAFA